MAITEYSVLGDPEDLFQIYPVLEMGSIPPHHHNFYEIQYFARGNCTVHSESGIVDVRAPMINICPPGDAWHQIVCEKSTVWISSIALYPRLLMRDGKRGEIDVPDHHESTIRDAYSCLLELTELTPSAIELKVPAARRIEQLITVMCEEFRLRLPGYLVRLRSSIEELLIITYREQQGIHVHPSIVDMHFSTDNKAKSVHSLGTEIQLERDRRVANAIKWMKSNLHDVVTNHDIADSMNLTEKHFVRLFSNEVGISPQRYHLRLRLEAAAEYLVNTQMSVSEVASTFGFKHPSHFHRRFREFYGTTPSLYRYFNRQVST